MATPDLDAHIDRLYQLPLDEFTGARNVLAKELQRPTIKDLEKPNIAAWAVNQLYWKERSAYNALVDAAERLRAEHRQLLAGKGSDIRDAEKAHRDAIRAARDKIEEILKESGHATSDATLTAVQETLESLPSGDHPGRLTRPLKPLGFEALSGFTIKPTGATPPSPAAQESASALRLVKSAKDGKREREEAKRRAEEERERKERQRQAEKELKAAEAAMLRAEEAVKTAEKTLAKLRAKRDDAVSEYQRVRLRAHD